MPLTQLPTELLEKIVSHALPEGFESLAVTCKRLYTLCIPLLEHHNNLRWHFQDFRYCKTNASFRFNQQLLRFPDTATSAFNLISRIAIEPVVGRYILEADFTGDSRLYSRFASASREETTYGNRDEAVRRLLADSPYLREAGLDWQEYYRAMMEDVNNCRHSQHAAAFVLTLLPNLRRFTGSGLWNLVPVSAKLIAAIIRIARQSTHNPASLSQITALEETRANCELSSATSLITLPSIRSFQSLGCIGRAHNGKAIGSRYLPSEFDSKVEVVGFWDASIDAVTIAHFLKRTPCLKSLMYWHSTNGGVGHQDWDLCAFIAAVQREVGSHLENLCAITTELRGSVSPGKPNLRHFQRLQCLELPLDIVIGGLKAAELTENKSSDSNSLLGDLVPASVTQLSLFSPGKSPHDKALELLFRDFATQKRLWTPNLKEIRLTCPDDADDLYKAQCTSLAAETKRAGVALELTEIPIPISTLAKDEEYYMDYS